MSHKGTRPDTFQDQQKAATLWLVCQDAAIPVNSYHLADELLQTLPCTHEHDVVKLNLRPYTLKHVYDHYRKHAWNQPANFKDPEDQPDGIQGMVSLMPEYPEDLPRYVSPVERDVRRLLENLEG